MTRLAVTLDTMYDGTYDEDTEDVTNGTYDTNELIDDIGLLDAIEEGII